MSNLLFDLNWRGNGDELVADLDLARGPVEVRIGSKQEKIQPAPGYDMITVTRRAFALHRGGHRLSSGQGVGVTHDGIVRTAYKAVLRVAAMEAVADTCDVCGEDRYPQGSPSIPCQDCNNDLHKRNHCRTCFTLGALYEPRTEDLRCINRSCSTRAAH